MDLNEYAAVEMVRDRHAELLRMAQREHLARRSAARRRWRMTVGTTLIRVGAWLLRDEYAAPGAA